MPKIYTQLKHDVYCKCGAKVKKVNLKSHMNSKACKEALKKKYKKRAKQKISTTLDFSDFG